ncbi:unnamed protein product [Arctogadus glacialis]
MSSVETAAEHERILREIESTDTNCIGPTLRSVYDGEEHGVFMGKLDGRIRSHDRDIERMCNHHFQGFVDSITELLKVRGEAHKLKSQVTETDRRLQQDGKGLMASMEELRQCRIQQKNIASTIDKLQMCLPVLEMYSKLQEQMEAKRYYPALRTLGQLEQTCLPRAGQYRFCGLMADSTPLLRSQIRDTAMTHLRDFLESIRKHSDRLGETAIKQAQVQRSLDSSTSVHPRALIGRRIRKELSLGAGTESNGQGGSPLSEQDSGILDVEDEEEEEEEEIPGAQDLVDFSPVYRCLHIYTVLLTLAPPASLLVQLPGPSSGQDQQESDDSESDGTRWKFITTRQMWRSEHDPFSPTIFTPHSLYSYRCGKSQVGKETRGKGGQGG